MPCYQRLDTCTTDISWSGLKAVIIVVVATVATVVVVYVFFVFVFVLFLLLREMSFLARARHSVLSTHSAGCHFVILTKSPR